MLYHIVVLGHGGAGAIRINDIVLSAMRRTPYKLSVTGHPVYLGRTVQYMVFTAEREESEKLFLRRFAGYMEKIADKTGHTVDYVVGVAQSTPRIARGAVPYIFFEPVRKALIGAGMRSRYMELRNPRSLRGKRGRVNGDDDDDRSRPSNPGIINYITSLPSGEQLQLYIRLRDQQTPASLYFLATLWKEEGENVRSIVEKALLTDFRRTEPRLEFVRLTQSERAPLFFINVLEYLAQPRLVFDEVDGSEIRGPSFTVPEFVIELAFDDSLAQFAERNLTSLVLEVDTLGALGDTGIAKLKQLEDLTLSVWEDDHSNISPRTLSDLPNLTSLTLHGVAPSIWNNGALARFTKLTTLRIAGNFPFVTDRDVESLVHIRHFEASENITDRGLRNMKNLESLVVNDRISDAALEHHAHTLLALDVRRSDGAITTAGIRLLKNLEQLYVAGGIDLDDSDILEMKNMRKLSLGFNNQVTGSGFFNMRVLEYLDIGYAIAVSPRIILARREQERDNGKEYVLLDSLEYVRFGEDNIGVLVELFIDEIGASTVETRGSLYLYDDVPLESTNRIAPGIFV